MLVALLGAIVAAPLFAWAVPERFRRELLLAASLVGLTLLDPRLPALALAIAGGVQAAARLMKGAPAARRGWIAAFSVALLVALFAFNKSAGDGGVVPSQEGLVLLGVSYLVLKAAAAILDAARGTLEDARFVEILAWIVFLPTYTSGPIEELEHFRKQVPRPSLADGLAGLERILFGLVKTLLLSHYLGELSSETLAEPAGNSQAALWLAFYATTLRLYFDFSGYSDIAIGVSALFGIRIQENFDHPLTRRNLVQLWQRWHMTLTGWLRRYLFVPVSRRLMRSGNERLEALAVPAAQIATMSVCGLWHGIGWNFLAWGALQAVGMIWVGSFAKPAGALLPAPLRAMWSGTRAGQVMSTLLTFHYFAATNILFFTGIDGSVAFFGSLFAR